MRTQLHDFLACPVCRGSLEPAGRDVRCVECGRSFAVRAGVPELLVEPAPEQRPPGLTGRTLAAIVARPAVYDLVQNLAGAQRVFAQVRPMLGEMQGVVLDVGAGTGALQPVLPRGSEYVWLDSDRRKLQGFRARSSSPAVLGDATALPFRDEGVDWATCAFVLHHLEDVALARLLDELRRVVRHGAFFIEPVPAPTLRSRVLWRYDRGRFPRSARELGQAVGERFSLSEQREVAGLHRYFAVSAAKALP
jgi:SAM-dependent methyltransferase